VITKLAVAGKGGSGKTVLASLLVRAFSERGLLVLAVDLDANPGLAVSLGITPYDIALPDDAIERRPDVPYGWGLARHLTPAEAVRRYSLRVADRVAFMGFGNMAGVDTPIHRYLTAVREVAAGFDEPGWVVVADLAPGPTNPFEGYAKLATLALVTVEGTATSILTAKRLAEILAHDDVPFEPVATNVRSPDELDRITAWSPPFGVVPHDPEVKRLGRAGSLVDLDPDSAALGAVRQLVTKLGF
jgi:CO dehydrogenase maturation factor